MKRQKVYLNFVESGFKGRGFYDPGKQIVGDLRLIGFDEQFYKPKKKVRIKK